MVQNKKFSEARPASSVIEQSGQTSVVLGDRVEAVYNEINALPSMSGHAEVTPRLRAGGRRLAGSPTSSTSCLTPSVLCWGTAGYLDDSDPDRVPAAVGFFGQYTGLTGQSVNIDIINGARVADRGC